MKVLFHFSASRSFILVILMHIITSSQGYSQTLNGYGLAYEYGVESQSIIIQGTTLQYSGDSWSSFSGWSIGLGSGAEVDPQYQSPQIFRVGLGFGMMKPLSNQSHWHQLWEARVIPGYEFWAGDMPDNRWTIGGYLNPRMSLFLHQKILVGVGPFGEYHFNSELSPYNYGAKTAFTFFIN